MHQSRVFPSPKQPSSSNSALQCSFISFSSQFWWLLPQADLGAAAPSFHRRLLGAIRTPPVLSKQGASADIGLV